MHIEDCMNYKYIVKKKPDERGQSISCSLKCRKDYKNNSTSLLVYTYPLHI